MSKARICSSWFSPWSKKLGSMWFTFKTFTFWEIEWLPVGLMGFSWGNYDAGIYLGINIHQFMPLHLLAWDIAGNNLADWCKSWMGTNCTPPLTTEGWFEAGHQPGVHLGSLLWQQRWLLWNSLRGLGINSLQRLSMWLWSHDCYGTRSGGLASRRKLIFGCFA
jgi:hypothetical protein